MFASLILLLYYVGSPKVFKTGFEQYLRISSYQRPRSSSHHPSYLLISASLFLLSSLCDDVTRRNNIRDVIVHTQDDVRVRWQHHPWTLPAADGSLQWPLQRIAIEPHHRHPNSLSKLWGTTFHWLKKGSCSRHPSELQRDQSRGPSWVSRRSIRLRHISAQSESRERFRKTRRLGCSTACTRHQETTPSWYHRPGIRRHSLFKICKGMGTWDSRG